MKRPLWIAGVVLVLAGTAYVAPRIVGVLLLCVGLAFAGLNIYMRRKQPQIFAKPVFDSVPPVLPELTGNRRVLVFSKTNGFRHGKAIDAANRVFQDLAAENKWTLFFTENAAVFNAEQLAQFEAVVWSNTSGSILTEAQQLAFQQWLQNGGGCLCIHGAGGDFKYDWRWYVDEVLRAQFVMHPLLRQLQTVQVNVEAPQHPVMAGIQSWPHKDEWYNFKQSPRGRATVLASIDESTYHPEIGAMGADHPVIWCHQVGDGRAVYSALGHSTAEFADPVHQQVLKNAVNWLLS